MFMTRRALSSKGLRRIVTQRWIWINHRLCSMWWSLRRVPSVGGNRLSNAKDVGFPTLAAALFWTLTVETLPQGLTSSCGRNCHTNHPIRYGRMDRTTAL
eukprot:PhF_6_TR6984/c0_g1_i1/m.10344